MKKIFSIFGCVFLILSLLIMASCSPEAYIDYHENDIDFYFNGSVPDDAIATPMFPQDDILKEYDYISAEYEYFVKNAEVWFGTIQGPGDYNLSVLSITYEPETYLSLKAYLKETLEYFTDTPELSFNGYDFYQYPNTGWAPYGVWFSFIYHAFNDEKNKMVFLKYIDHRRKSDPEDEYLRKNDFVAFLDKYYGEYYDFHA